MTGARFFSAAAALSFVALFLVVFGVISVVFVDIAFFVEAFAVLLVIAGVAAAIAERITSWGKPASFYLT